jgi:general secretion pathway protein M
MISRLSPPQSRLLAITLLLLCVAVVVQVIALPAWRVYHKDQQAVELHRDQIERFKRIAKSAPEIQQHLRELEERRKRDQYVLTEESTILAAAVLQERVKAIIEQSGGRLTSTQVPPAVAEGAYNKVTVKVRMSVTTPALQSVLYELESGVPYLVVDNVAVLARRARRRRETQSQPQTLDVRFDLSGFMPLNRG